MTLDELDEKIARVLTPIEDEFKLAYHAERKKENRAIAKLECPECGCSLTADVSQFGTGVIYYSCSNPNVTGLPHIFIRTR